MFLTRLLILFILLLSFSTTKAFVNTKDSFKLIPPKFKVGFSFNIPEFYNYGFEINGTYYHLSKRHIRIGTELQTMYFFAPYKNWFNIKNKEKSLSSEWYLNALVNVEVIPFRKNTFFIGIAPYIGYQFMHQKGSSKFEPLQIDVSWNEKVNQFDWGLRYQLGGYIDRKQRFGLIASFQMSARGIADNDPRTKFVNIGMIDYKTFVGIGFCYRIK